MTALFDFIVERLKDPAAVRGIVLIASAVGATLTPEQANTIVVAALGVVGFIGAFWVKKS